MASAVVYGANKHVEATDGVGVSIVGPWVHSVMAESNLQLDQENSVFGRVEYVRKNGEELSLPGALREQDFDIGTLSLGYIREFARYRGATLGLGARGGINLIPRALEGVYGCRTPSCTATIEG